MFLAPIFKFIKSNQNHSYSQLRFLYRRKKTTEHCIELQGEILYGIQPVKLCLLANRRCKSLLFTTRHVLFRTVHCLYYNPGSVKAAAIADEGRGRGVACEELSRPGLDSLCRQVDRYKEHHVHQGIVADVSRLRHVLLLFVKSDYR